MMTATGKHRTALERTIADVARAREAERVKQRMLRARLAEAAGDSQADVETLQHELEESLEVESRLRLRHDGLEATREQADVEDARERLREILAQVPALEGEARGRIQRLEAAVAELENAIEGFSTPWRDYPAQELHDLSEMLGEPEPDPPPVVPMDWVDRLEAARSRLEHELDRAKAHTRRPRRGFSPSATHELEKRGLLRA